MIKKKQKADTDMSNAYRENGSNMIKAPLVQNDGPRVTKTVATGDLRAPKGR